MNGVLIVVDYCLQVKEITRRFELDDMARAKDLLERFKETMPTDEYNYTMGIINRLYESWR